MTVVRLIADDLTGALDTAAELVPLAGALTVRLGGTVVPCRADSLAVDMMTREVGPTVARARAEAAATLLADADIAFVKVDSLLRGHPMTELSAYWRGGGFDHCIIAPAFPDQGRVTRGGVQYRRDANGVWRKVADLATLAADAGLPLASGAVRIADAGSRADLSRVVETGRALAGRVLWCGTAGLALAMSEGQTAPRVSELPRPFLGLFGSDQSVTARQLAACGSLWLRFADAGLAAARDVEDTLRREHAAFVSFSLPADLTRQAAARRIAGLVDDLLGRLPRPGTLIVSGGETLRAVCEALGAESLRCTGQLEPGVPLSVLQGGRWDGLTVVSKSGAFGRESIWRDLLAAHGIKEKAAS